MWDLTFLEQGDMILSLCGVAAATVWIIPAVGQNFRVQEPVELYEKSRNLSNVFLLKVCGPQLLALQIEDIYIWEINLPKQ